MASAASPGESEITGFLRALRKYRRTLSGPSQALLDSLVAAGLGRTPNQAAEEELQFLWCAYAAGAYGWSDGPGGSCGADPVSWETTPWGLACRARYE